MAHDPQTLSIKPGQWCAQSAALLALAMPGANTDELRHQLAHCGARLFHVWQGDTLAAAFVLRVDHTSQGSEGVIVAGAGRADGCDLIATCMPAIESLFQNCRRVRYHTRRASLARKLAGLGYVGQEIVCMKELEK